MYFLPECFNPVINQTEALTHARLGLFQCDVLGPWSILNYPKLLCIDFQSQDPKEYIRTSILLKLFYIRARVWEYALLLFLNIAGNAFRWKVCAREQFLLSAIINGTPVAVDQRKVFTTRVGNLHSTVIMLTKMEGFLRRNAPADLSINKEHRDQRARDGYCPYGPQPKGQ